MFRAISCFVLFVKRGERVEAEAAALGAARHPGVVELVDVVDGALRTTLLAGARPLAEAGPLTADEMAGVMASVAGVLADLHDRGVVHGGIDAGHVLVTADGRPVLCSLGRGGTPAGDVAALGATVASLLAAAPAPAPVPVGDSRSPWPARLGRWRPARPAVPPAGAPGPVARSTGPGRFRRPARLGPMLAPPAGPVLAALVAEVTAAAPEARPTARAVAAAIHQRVPTARLPRPQGPPLLPLAVPRPAAHGTGARQRRPGAAPPTAATGAGPVTGELARPRARVRRRAAPFGGGAKAPAGGARPSEGGAPRNGTRIAALAAGAAVVAGAVVAVPRVLSGRPPGDGAAPAQPSASTSDRPASTAAPDGPAGSNASTPAPVAVRVWPPEPLDFRDGVLTVDGARYALGQPGDAVVAGDWACTGQRTLALLRPGTGEVFSFAGWPAEGENVAARSVGTVAGATGVRVVDADGDGCDDLEVDRSGAGPVRLEPAA